MRVATEAAAVAAAATKEVMAGGGKKEREYVITQRCAVADESKTEAIYQSFFSDLPSARPHLSPSAVNV